MEGGNDDLAHVGPCGTDRARAFRQLATTYLRQWLAAPGDDDALSILDAIGAEAVRSASDLTRRFDLDSDATRRTRRALEELRALVETIHAGRPRTGFRLFARPDKPMEDRLREAEPRLAASLEELAHGHDQLAREGIRLRGLLDELRAADRALEEAIHLCRALETAFGAASRELDGMDPIAAARLRGPLAIRLAERLRDLLTQLVVLRQGRLSLDLIAGEQAMLARAVDRTRHTLVAALRTAAAARRSAGRQPISRRPEAPGSPGQSDLERAVDAMRSALARSSEE
jgi:hypothetical protein